MTDSVRAIYDTNVFVAAGFKHRSACARLIKAARDGRIQMVWCPATRAETERVLTKIPPLDWDAVADVFRADGEAPDSDPGTAGFVTDPDDRKFAALSMATGVPIISADSDLTVHAGRLDVWSAGAFWAKCGF